VNKVLRYLQEDKCVFVDMRGRQDDEYTMLAALLARRLLTENRKRADADQIRACLIMEEAHNILSEEELYKGGGRGSVFIELAREGRSFKIGFILVTQQPDARSIAQQVVKTIDTVIAFHMPPDDAKYLQRLKPGFTGLELEIANAETFQGIAVADSGPVLFKSEPVNDPYMAACASGTLASHICGSDSTSVRMSGQRGGEVAPPAEADKEPGPAKLSINERLLRLSKARQENIEKVALDTMRAWRDDSLGLSDRNEAAG